MVRNGGSRAATTAKPPTGRPPLKFNSVHGPNIKLTAGDRRAESSLSYGGGIVFSDRPIAMDERVNIRLARIQQDKGRSLINCVKFGVTSILSNSHQSEHLPTFFIGSHSNYWMHQLLNEYTQQDNLLQFFVSSCGVIHYSINGDDKAIACTGVDTNFPLWVTVELYGREMAIEFESPPEAQMDTPIQPAVIESTSSSLAGGNMQCDAPNSELAAYMARLGFGTNTSVGAQAVVSGASTGHSFTFRMPLPSPGPQVQPPSSDTASASFFGVPAAAPPSHANPFDQSQQQMNQPTQSSVEAAVSQPPAAPPSYANPLATVAQRNERLQRQFEFTFRMPLPPSSGSQEQPPRSDTAFSSFQPASDIPTYVNPFDQSLQQMNQPVQSGSAAAFTQPPAAALPTYFDPVAECEQLMQNQFEHWRNQQQSSQGFGGCANQNQTNHNHSGGGGVGFWRNQFMAPEFYRRVALCQRSFLGEIERRGEQIGRETGGNGLGATAGGDRLNSQDNNRRGPQNFGGQSGGGGFGVGMGAANVLGPLPHAWNFTAVSGRAQQLQTSSSMINQGTTEASGASQTTASLVAPVRAALSGDNQNQTPSSSSRDECSICFVAEVNTVILPCWHLCACFECAEKCKNSFGTCPICRKRITQVQRVFKA